MSIMDDPQEGYFHFGANFDEVQAEGAELVASLKRILDGEDGPTPREEIRAWLVRHHEVFVAPNAVRTRQRLYEDLDPRAAMPLTVLKLYSLLKQYHEESGRFVHGVQQADRSAAARMRALSASLV